MGYRLLKDIELTLSQKQKTLVFESYEFQYSFKENPLRKFSAEELLEELIRREK
ncbi:MAG: hypothetical protein ACRDDH_17265 [Cetobacterium sp.]|uniref:hypothetical protein n=1 Tax=Cetobacterium sp. TaxID=2071632 RepID=UPI003EE8099A